jgi:hypothetical protein
MALGDNGKKYMKDLASYDNTTCEQSICNSKFVGLNPTTIGARLEWESYMQDLAVAVKQLVGQSTIVSFIYPPPCPTGWGSSKNIIYSQTAGPIKNLFTSVIY